MTPSISVIVPTYNRAEFIPACVESILHNSVPDVEVVIVDDGSTDDTADVVRALDGPVRYLRQRNSGPAAARNHGFGRSRGRYVWFLDSDDAWLPDGPRLLYDALEQHPEDGVAFGDTLMGNDVSGWTSFIDTYGADAFRNLPRATVGLDLARLEPGPFFRQLAVRNVMFLGSLLVRREVFVASGGFHEPLCGAADWDFFLRLAACQPVLYASHVPVSKYLKHDVAMSNNASHMNRDFILALAHVLETADLSPADAQHVRVLLRRHRFDWAYVAYDEGRLAEARQRFVEAVRASGPSTRGLSPILLCAVRRRLLSDPFVPPGERWQGRPMHVLFYKADFAWPRASGHDVHTYHMMRSMAALGVRVSLATVKPPPPAALAGARIEHLLTIEKRTDEPAAGVTLRRFEERFRSYWGIPPARIQAFGRFSRDIAADAVVVSGLDVLPMLGDIDRAVRIWYAGDEWAWHHLSQVRLTERASWINVKDAAVKGLYERAYRRRIDRAWTVSEPDRRALRRVAGVRNVDTIANGIGTDVYHPLDIAEEPDTAVFWGRLDFGPNIQALQWFVREVWPMIRAARATARFTIVGFHPTKAIEELCRVEGVSLTPDVPDIRPEVARAAVVVLPFVSGGGIKNKLLEAAAMGKAIVATPRALLGLRGDAPVRVARDPREWARQVLALWGNTDVRRSLGEQAHAWVTEHHTWGQAAQIALRGIEQSLFERART